MTNTKQTLFDFIEGIKNNYGIEPCTKDTDFVFKRLDIKDANGFIVYSKERIDKDNWFKDYNQKNKQMKNGRSDNPTLADLGDKEDYACRYYYYEKLETQGKHVTIVMINPAFAYSEKLDRTINNIRTNLKKIKVSSFDIVNISPIRNPYTDSFVKLESKKYYVRKDYNDFLDHILKSADVILPAWGNAIMKKELKFIKNKMDDILCKSEICSKVCILKKTKKGNPMHLLRVKDSWEKLTK